MAIAHGALQGANMRAGAAPAQGTDAGWGHIGGMLRLAQGCERCTAWATARQGLDLGTQPYNDGRGMGQ